VTPPGRTQRPSGTVPGSSAQWIVLLLIGALAVIGLGVWQLALGQSRNGILLISIAVIDCAWVAYLYHRRNTR
jgi:hypothetical protein